MTVHADPTVGLDAIMSVNRPGFSLEAEVSVAPATTLVLLGPNGAGKSTLVEALAGLAPIDGGRITLGGRVLDDPATGPFVGPEDRRIGIVFQDYLLFDHLTVADNVAFPVRHRSGRPRRGARAARDEVWPLLDALDLADLADRRPDRLSGGQAQRVALARALAGRPDLLLLDEPLAAVDVSTRARLRRTLLAHLEHYPGPRVVITHDPAEAFALADRLAIIESGRIVQEGTPAEVQRHPATPWVATLTGTNLLPGWASASLVTLDAAEVASTTDRVKVASTTDREGVVLTTTTDLEGRVNAIIDPRAVALHHEEPGGSPRNTWKTTVEWIEPLGRTTRVRLAAPLPLNVDITPSSAEALDLRPGRPVWAAVKATEIGVQVR